MANNLLDRIVATLFSKSTNPQSTKRRRVSRFLTGAVLTAALVFGTQNASAQEDIYWNVQSGKWENAANWNPRPSGGAAAYYTAYIDNGGTAFADSPINGPSWELSVREIVVGESGTGELNLSGNAEVRASGSILLGFSSGSSGRVTVDGIGSELYSGTGLSVGESGTGVLNLTGGGKASSASSASPILLGYRSGSSGTVTVDGSGSELNGGSLFFVGYSGAGVLNLTGGGKATAQDRISLGYRSGSSGTVTVDGSGSELNSDSLFFVGEFGTGVLNLTDGGKVFAMSLSVGGDSVSSGTVTVGAGSTLTVSSNVLVGNWGTGFFAGTGTVIAPGSRGFTVASTGTLSPGDTDGQIGTLSITGALQMDAGSTLRVDLGSQGNSDRIITTGVASFNSINVDLSSLRNGTYTLAVGSSAFLSGNTKFLLAGEAIPSGSGTRPGTGLSTSLSVIGGQVLNLTVSGAPNNGTLTWTGAAGDGKWNLYSKNWNNSSQQFWDGDAVVFNSGGGTVTIVGRNGEKTHKTVADMTVNGTQNWEFIGDITADGARTTMSGRTGKLVVDTTGRVRLRGNNHFEGGVEVRKGYLVLGKKANETDTYSIEDTLGMAWTDVVLGYGGLTGTTGTLLVLEGNDLAFTATGGADQRYSHTANKGAIELEKNAVFSISNNKTDRDGGALNIWANTSFDLVTATSSEFRFSENTAARGGAILTKGDMKIGNVVFDGNTARTGGAIYVESGTVNFLNGADFSGNTATTATAGETNGAYGGALSIAGGTVNLNNATFSGNSATATNTTDSGYAYGGALSIAGGTVNLNNATFSGNSATATNTTDSGYAYGGALYIAGGTVNLDNATFSGNMATATNTTDSGYAQGGAISYAGGTLKFTGDTVFENNKTARSVTGFTDGGAIYASGLLDLSTSTGSLTFKDNIAGNTSGGSGGGISSSSSVTLGDRVTFTGNIAGNNGVGSGGGISSSSATSTTSVTLGDQATFTGNIAGNNGFGEGGGIYSFSTYNSSVTLGNRVTFRGNIAGNNTSGFGGGISSSSSSSSVTLGSGAHFAKNRAGGNNIGGYGGAIRINSNGISTLSLHGNTFFEDNLVSRGTNSLGGAIYIDGGASSTVTLDTGITGGGYAPIAFSGNKIDVDTSNIHAIDPATSTANSIHLGRNTKLDLKGNGNIYFDDPISSGTVGGNSLVKSGTGFVQFLGDNRLNTAGGSGNTVDIQAGTFRLANGAAFNASGAGTFNVATAATLAGQGTITASAFTISGRVAPDADRFEIPTFDTTTNSFATGRTTVSDTKKVGTLSLSGNTTFSGATLAVDLASATSYDKVAVTGNAAYTGTTVIDLSDYREGDYTGLVTSTGTMTGFNNYAVTLNGTAIGARQQAKAVVSGKSLDLSLLDGVNLNLTWNRTENDGIGNWGLRARNWKDATGTVDTFQHGDYVVFNNAADKRTITVSGAYVAVSGMEITAGEYSFNNDGTHVGVIYVDRNPKGDKVTSTKKLTISGANTVALFNNNVYATNGVEVSGGATLGGSGLIEKLAAGFGTKITPGAASGEIGTLSVVSGANFSGTTFLIDIDPNASGQKSDLVSVNGDANFSGANILTANFNGGVQLGTYDFVTSTGTVTDNGTWSYSLGSTLLDGYNLNARGSGITQSGNKLQLKVALDNLAIDWTGSDSGTWTNIASTANSGNWTNNNLVTPETKFRDGDRVTFNNTPAQKSVNLATNVAVADMTVTGGATYTFTGTGGVTGTTTGTTISGAAGKLAVTGNSTAILANTGTNNFVATEIDSGSTVQIGNGGTTGNLTGTIVNNGILNITRSNAYTLNNTIFGGGVTKMTGTGTLTIGGSGNSQSNAFEQTAGTVNLANQWTGNYTQTGGTLTGNGTIEGNTVFSGIIQPGTAGALKTLNVLGDTTLKAATLAVNLGATNTSDRIAVTGTTTLDDSSGKTTVNLLQYRPGTYTIYTTTGFGAAIDQNTFMTKIGGSDPGTRQGVTYTAASDKIEITLANVTNTTLFWTGNTDNVWRNTNNFRYGMSSPETFSDGDGVTFNSSGLQGEVKLNDGEPVVAWMNVNSGGDYTFTGTGGITGSKNSNDTTLAAATGILTVVDAGTKVVFANTGTNTFVRSDIGSGAAVQIGNNNETGSLNGEIRNDGSMILARTGSYTMSNAITGGGTVTMNDLDAVLTFTGTSANKFVQNGGALNLTGNLTGGITQNVGTTNKSTLTGGGMISGASTLSGIVAPTGTLTVADAHLDGMTLHIGVLGTDVLKLTNTPTSGMMNTLDIGQWDTGTFTVIDGPAGADFAGRFDTAVTLNGQSLSSRQLAVFSTTTDDLIVTLSASNAIRTWIGGESGNWDKTTENWQEDDKIFVDGDRVVFDTTLGQTSIWITNGGMTVGDMTVQGDSDYTFSGSGITADETSTQNLVGATGKLIKTGASTLTLNNANDFKNGTDLDGGRINLGNASGLGSQEVRMASGTTLGFNGNFDIWNPITTTGNVTVNSGNHTVSIGGVIGGGGSVTKTGDGTLIFKEANSYAGTTTISAGRLRLEGDGTVGDGNVIFDGAGVSLGLGDGVSLANAIVMTTGGTVDIDEETDTATLGGVISGTNNLTKTGDGTLTLSGNSSTFGGSFIHTEGGLHLAATAALGGTFTQDSGTTVTSTNGATLADATFKGTVTPTGTLNLTSGSFDGATIDLGNLSSTPRNMISATGNVDFINNVSTVRFNATGAATHTYTLISSDNLTGFDDFVEVDATLASNQRGGTYVENDDLMYSLITGTTDLLWKGSTSAAWNTSETNKNWTDGHVDTYFVTGDSVTFDVNGVNKSVTVATAGVSVGKMVVNNSTGNNYTFSGGSITGPLEKSGTGTARLNNANTFDSVALNQGSIVVGNDGALGTATVNMADGTTLGFAGAHSASNNLAITGTATVDSGTFAATLNGTISGGSLHKTGSGSLSIQGANLVNLDVANGRLNIAAGKTVTATGSVNFANGTMLGVGENPSINAQDVSIGTGTTLDLTSISGPPYSETVLIRSANAISGSFGAITVGGTNQSGSMSLDKYVNDVIVQKSLDEKSYIVQTDGLVWNNTAPNSAHGTFNIATQFEITESLADNGIAVTHYGGWDGKSLTKRGEGVLTLKAANTYSGNTTVEEGTLALAHANAVQQSGLILRSGSTLKLEQDSSATSLNASDATIDLGAGNKLSVDSASMSGENTVNINLSTAGEYTLLESTAIVSNWNSSVANAQSVRGGQKETDHDLQYKILAVGAKADLVYGGGHWNTTDTNWSDDGFLFSFENGDNVTFDGSQPERTVDIADDVTVGNMTVSTDGYTFGGSKIDGTTLSLGAGSTTTFGNLFEFGEIAGSGNLTYTGTDELVISGTNTNTGTFTQQGDVRLASNWKGNYAQQSGVFSAAANAVIGGKADFNGTMNLGGKLSVGGDVTLDDVALNVSLAYDGTSTVNGTIETTGSLNVDGGTLNVADGGVEAAAVRKAGNVEFDILKADGGISGTGFTSVDIFSSRFFISNYYQNNNRGWVDVVYNDQTKFTDYSWNHNTNEVAANLDASMDDPAMQDLINGIIGDDARILAGLDTLRGTELAANAQSMALWNPWDIVNKRLYAEDSVRLGNGYRGQCGKRSNRDAWVEGYYRDIDVRRDGNASKYDGRRGGTMVGLDSRLNCWSKVGVVFGYGEPKVSNRFGKIEADDYTIGLYSKVRVVNELYANAFLGYGNQSYESKRTDIAGFHRAKYDGDSMYASLEFFRPLKWRNKATLFPLFALDYQRSWTDGFTESGDYGQKVGKADMDRFVMRIGLNSKIRWNDRLHVSTRLQYGYLLGGDVQGVANTRFAAASPTSPVMSLRGVNLGRNQFNVGLGGEWKLTNRTRLFGDYDFDLGDRSTAHTGQVGLVTNW